MDITRRLQNIPHKHKRIYILLSASWTFSKIDLIHGNKANLNRHKKIGFIIGVLSGHYGFFFNFSSILCAQDMKNLSHLKEKLILKFIKPINNQRPNHYIKTNSLARKNLSV